MFIKVNNSQSFLYGDGINGVAVFIIIFSVSPKGMKTGF